MASLNTATVVARLVADPMPVETKSKEIMCIFTLAVVRPRGQGVFQLECRAFGKVASYVIDLFHGGEMIGVTGSLARNRYKDKHGVHRDNICLNVVNVCSAEKEAKRYMPEDEITTLSADEDDIIGEMPY